MNLHQPKKPLIIIDFDKAIYKDGRGFKDINFYKLETPRIKEKSLYFLDTLKNRYDINLLSKKHFLEAACWTIRNKLDKNCIKSLIAKKTHCTYFFEKL